MANFKFLLDYLEIFKFLYKNTPHFIYNFGIKMGNLCYKDRRANAPFLIWRDRIGYNDRRANAPLLIGRDRIGYKDRRANAPFVVCEDDHWLQRSQG